MDNWIIVGRLILIILLSIFEIWSFRNHKSLKTKLLPMILLSAIGLLFIGSVPFLGVIGGIFAILIIELALICSMLVVLGELFLILISSRRNLKKILLLASSFLLFALIYYLGEKVF